MRILYLCLFSLLSNILFAQFSLPKDAEVGKCYAVCFIPHEYETWYEKVKIKEAYTTLEVIPVVYDTIEEKVLVQEGYMITETIPPVFKTVTQKVILKDSSLHYKIIEPTFEKDDEVIQTQLSHKYWTYHGQENCSDDQENCEVWCLNEFPAKYETVSKAILKTPAKTTIIAQSPIYQTIEKRIMIEPPKTIQKRIPPVYKSIQRIVIKTPEQVRLIEHPAEYKEIKHKKLWRRTGFSSGMLEVPCDIEGGNEDIIRIEQLQHELKKKGFYKEAINGIFDSDTKGALIRFQKSIGWQIGKFDDDYWKKALFDENK